MKTSSNGQRLLTNALEDTVSSRQRADDRLLASRIGCGRYSPIDAHGPVIANVIPDSWMFTKSHTPSRSKHAPYHSELAQFPRPDVQGWSSGPER